LLSIEEFGEHGLNLGDTGRSTDKYDFVDLSLGRFGVLQNSLNWGHALTEEVNAELFELGTRESEREILTLSKGLALNISLMSS